MRKSILALALGGLVATATFGAATPASADHQRTTIIRDGERVVVIKRHAPVRKVVIRSAKPRKIVTIRPDGTRVVRWVHPRRDQVAIIRRD